MRPIFLHLHSSGESNWTNEKMSFDRIPVEGEYLTIDVESGWYKVEAVIHTPFSEEMAAEVYAVEVDYKKELKLKVNI